MSAAERPAPPRPLAGAPRAAGALDGRAIAVFGSSTLCADAPGWPLAEDLGRRLAAAGARVLNGGYGGAMEAVSRGARAGGGHVTGVTLATFRERVPNPHLSEARHTATLMERLAVLLAADGFVALDGSLGTLAEFFLAWNHVLLEDGARPLVCLGEGWRDRLARLREDGFVSEPGHFRFVRVAVDAADAVALLATHFTTVGAKE